MKKIDVLGPLGALVMLASWIAFREAKPLPGKLEYYLAGGAALIAVHLALRWEDIARGRGRQLRYGSNMLVLVLAVLGILGAANYLVNRHTKRWDLTKNKRYSLSDQTRKILGNLKDEVKLTYFQYTADMAFGQDRLKQFESASAKLKVEYVDPRRNPTRARAYGVDRVPTLVLERGAQRETVQGESEQEIVNGLIKVTREGKKSVCFAEGEGEKDIDDSSERGFSAAKSLLEKSQYGTQKVILLREKKVPENCTILVVSGPQKDLLPQAVDPIRDFVKAGGKAFVMVDPEFQEPYSNLTGLLRDWNLETRKDVVVDVSGIGQLFGTGELTPIAAQYPYHEITRDFRVMTAYHEARSLEPGSGTKEGVFAQKLVETSSASWAESDLALKGPVDAKGKDDRQGPISLAAVATVRPPEPSPSPSPAASPSPSPSPSPSASPGEGEQEEKPEEKKPEGRVVAFGDSDWASNALLGFQGNKDLFLNAIAWLSQDTDLISIRPREPDDQRLFLTANQSQNVWLFSVILIPGLFVAMGIGAWWRRR
jgi:ABC-type uncharacterized transport system involved in gliding motility auxiliary subunit